MLGVIIGVGALVAILAIGDGLERFTREQIERTTDLHALVISPKTTDQVDGIVIQRPDPALLTPADAHALGRHLSGKAMVTLTLNVSRWLSSAADSPQVAVLVTGLLPDAEHTMGLSLAAGRFVDSSDVALDARVAVATRRLAIRLGFGREPASLLGHEVRLGDLSYRIVGVAGGDAADGSPRVLVPLSPAFVERARMESRLVPSMVVKAAKVEEGESVRRTTEEWLAARFGPVERHFTLSSSRQRIAQIAQAMQLFKLGMGAIAGISLLVGGIGIMNVLLASVSERTREIGVRRSTGARKRDVLLQFLAESVAIAVIGSLWGIALGMGASAGITAVMRQMTAAEVYPVFTGWTVAIAVGAASVIGIVFGLYPALRAARLSPTEALRYD
jgi:putative ABC transport system permease protein